MKIPGYGPGWAIGFLSLARAWNLSVELNLNCEFERIYFSAHLLSVKTIYMIHHLSWFEHQKIQIGIMRNRKWSMERSTNKIIIISLADLPVPDKIMHSSWLTLLFTVTVRVLFRTSRLHILIMAGRITSSTAKMFHFHFHFSFENQKIFEFVFEYFTYFLRILENNEVRRTSSSFFWRI
jgi:hypothetical protein